MRHPVWQVYDEWRTARLNVDYYSHFLRKYERRAQRIDIFLALTAPGSAVAGLWLWSTETGKIIWGAVALVVAVVAGVKPFLKLPEKIKVHEQLVTGFRGLDHDLKILSQVIEQDQCYSAKHQQQLADAMDRRLELSEMEPKAPQDDKLVKKLQEGIKGQLSVENFYLPEEDSNDDQPTD